MPITLTKPKPVEKESRMKKVGKVIKGAVGGALKGAKKVMKKMPKRGRGRMKMRKVKPVAKAIKKASPPGTLYNAQRAKYEKAMNSAMKKGGSNGVGVGY